MKKRSLVALALVALFAAAGLVAPGLAQERRPPIVGGYKPVDKDSEEVLEAAEFAVGARGEKEGTTIKLVSVQSAERQTVAGMNYRLCMRVEVAGDDGEAEVAQDVKVVVYRNLKKVYSLTSWEEAECGESD